MRTKGTKYLLLWLLLFGALPFWSGCNMVRMPSKSFRGPLPPLTEKQAVRRKELRAHVEKLAGEIGERNVLKPAQLRAAADYIEGEFAKMGYATRRQSYIANGESFDNLEVEIPGNALPDEIVVVGAHYDSCHGSPAANDNASGVASLLVLAEKWKEHQSSRTIRFVAFVNEEPPFFQTDYMGSLVYARRCRERGENISAMISLETMGYFNTAKGSQNYPPPFGFLYPSKGDFIAFVGNYGNGKLVRRCIKTFRETTSFPSEGAALPGKLPGIGWSDHWSFWQVDYPAIMVTDTAPFRYPHYHTAEDTPDKIDYGRLGRVVEGLEHVILELSDAE